MNSLMVRAAIGFVRVWTVIYTCRLPVAVRDSRRAEITSDVWHSMHDPDRDASWRLALQMILRLVLGIPDDLRWRSEQFETTRRPRIRTALAGGALGLLVFAIASTFWRTPPLPQAPDSPTQLVAHPPPAPPPAPPAPLHSTTDSRQPVPEPVFANTSYTVATNAAAPTRIKDVRPVYPPIAVSYGVQGVVVVQARITDAGRIADARVLQPAGLLSQSAIDAVRQWEFDAATVNTAGNPILITVTARFVAPR